MPTAARDGPDGRRVRDSTKTASSRPCPQFATTRVPVSLAVLLDISDSMVGERLKDARHALDRFLFELLAKEDEYALILFNHTPTIAARWTSEPEVMRPALDAHARLGRHGDLRRGERVAAAVRVAASSAGRRRHHLGRRRHGQRHRAARSARRSCRGPTRSSTRWPSIGDDPRALQHAREPVRAARKSRTTRAATPRS